MHAIFHLHTCSKISLDIMKESLAQFLIKTRGVIKYNFPKTNEVHQ